MALSTVSWLACEGDSAPRAPPATDEAVVPRPLTGPSSPRRPSQPHWYYLQDNDTNTRIATWNHHIPHQITTEHNTRRRNLVALLKNREVTTRGERWYHTREANRAPKCATRCSRAYPRARDEPRPCSRPVTLNYNILHEKMATFINFVRTHHTLTLYYTAIFKLSQVNYRPDVTINAWT